MYREFTILCLFAMVSILMVLPVMAWSALADPTRPAFLSEKKAVKKQIIIEKPLILSSTLVSNNRKVAIINDKVVGEGETVDNALILRISRNFVQVKRNQKVIILRLILTEDVKKSATLTGNTSKE